MALKTLKDFRNLGSLRTLGALGSLRTLRSLGTLGTLGAFKALGFWLLGRLEAGGLEASGRGVRSAVCDGGSG